MILPSSPSSDTEMDTEIYTKSEYIRPLISITPSATSQTIDVVMYDGVGVIYSNFDLFTSFTVDGNQIITSPTDYSEYSENGEPIYFDGVGYTYAWYITGDATITPMP